MQRTALYKYGDSTSSRLSYINKNGAQRIASWHISHAEDVFHNYITYSYETTNLNIRPTVITYGTNNSVSRGITNTVTFGYRSLGDRSQPFTIEDCRGKADVVLTDITTATNGVTYRRYELKYDETSDKGHTQFSRLVQIDECDRYGKKHSPIKIDWNYIGDLSLSGRSLNVPTKDASIYIEENSRQFLTADLNGDGISDIIRVSQASIIDYQGGGITSWHNRTLVYISRSHIGENNTVTYDNPIKFEFQDTSAVLDWISVIGGTSVMDFDGDGYNDLLFPLYTNDDGKYSLTLYTLFGKDIKSGNTTSIDRHYILLTASTECPLFCTFDADGNGKDDVLLVETTPEDGYYNGRISYHNGNESLQYTSLKFMLPSKPEKMFTADYNNDGLTDIILLYNGGHTIYYNNGSTPSGQCFTEDNKKTGTDFGNNWRVQQGDFDGDGLMDFVYNVSPETWMRIARNNGDGTFTHGCSEDLDRSNQSTSKDDDKFAILVWDMNNDGKSDVFVSKANYRHHGGISGSNDYTSTTMKWLYSDGTTLKVFNETEKYHPEDATQNYLMLGDFNGDGAVELANYGTMISTSSETLDEKIHVYSMGTSVPGLGKIKKITDGLGRGIRIQYTSAAMPSVYTKANDEAYPLNTYCLPVAVVSSTSLDNGAAGIQYLKYKYGGLKLHIAGKGMLGFTEVTKENTTAGIKETQTVVQRDGRHLIPTEVKSVTTIGGSTSETVSRTTVADTDNGNYFAYVSETEAVDFDGNMTVSSTVYDTAKGVVTEETVLYDGDDMYRQTAYSGYEKRGGRWLPTTVTATQKHADSAVPFTDVTEYTYDDKGNVTAKTEHSGTDMQLVTSTTYDAYGNVLSSQQAGQGYTKTYDAWGNITSSSDPISEVEYIYSSNGKPESVSTNGTEVTMTYDAAGNKTSLTDPDAGTSTYTYAADGRLLSEKDGRDVETTYSFDASGRVISSTAGDITTTYTYGTSGFGAQRIIRKETGGNSVEYTYDRYGRVVEEQRNIKNHGTYTFSHTYNSDNLLEKTCYPGGLEVSYVYDEYGFRTQVLVNGSTLCSVDDYDGLSYTTSFMGGLTATDTRDARGFTCDRRLLCGTDTLEALCLNYDGSTDNLLSRKRNNSAEETFGYDSLDRLVSVSSGGEETMSMVYAPNGNILNKTGIGNYEYDSEYKPHAVMAVDNVGGKIPDDIINTEYNDFGKISKIELLIFPDAVISKVSMSVGLQPLTGDNFISTAGTMAYDITDRLITDTRYQFIMDFTYGPDGERWYTSFSNKGNTLSSTIYAGNYEKFTEYGATWEFYYLDDNTIVIKKDGEFKPYITFTDNLGSILAVFDENGNRVFNASYDAWGKQTVTLNTIKLKRGYTGHEMLSSFCLINMNGRLYDPDLGRFLSTDNFVQMPDNSQNFNRYSYCLNNPMKYTDPTGEIFGIDDAVFFGIASGAMMGFMNAKMNGTSLLKGTIMGSISPVASYGVGSAFGHGLGTLGHELLRAGAHGLTNGVINAINGDNFVNGFVTGMTASLAGSAAQALHFNTLGVISSSTITGELVSWASGGDFLKGALTGLNIGALNHKGLYIRYYHDANGNICGILWDVEVFYNNIAREAIQAGEIYASAATALNTIKGINDYVKKCRMGTNGKVYLPKITELFMKISMLRLQKLRD